MARTEIQVNAADRIVTLSVSGSLGDQELLNLAGELEKHPGVQPDFSLLVDFRLANGGIVTSAGVRALAELSQVLFPSSRRAVVVPSDLGFGMARMYSILRNDENSMLQVFRDFDEAQRWVAGKDDA